MSVPDLEWKIVRLLAKFFRRVCQNCLLRDQNKTFRESFLGKMLIDFAGTGAKKVRLSVTTFSTKLSELHCTCSEELFTTFFSKILLFVTFSSLEQKIFRLMGKIYQQWCQNCIVGIQKSVLRDFLDKLSFLNHLRSLNRNISALWQNYLAELSKTSSTCP